VTPEPSTDEKYACQELFAVTATSGKSFVCSKDGDARYYHCDKVVKCAGYYNTLQEGKKACCPNAIVQLADGVGVNELPSVHFDEDDQYTPQCKGQLAGCNFFNKCCPGLECLNGICAFTPKADPGRTTGFTGCTSDSDCIEGRQCVEGQCKSGESGAECNENSDCKNGYFCEKQNIIKRATSYYDGVCKPVYMKISFTSIMIAGIVAMVLFMKLKTQGKPGIILTILVTLLVYYILANYSIWIALLVIAVIAGLIYTGMWRILLLPFMKG
jgi:hypothetical protein